MPEAVKHKQKQIQRKEQIKNSMEEYMVYVYRGMADSLVMMNVCSVTESGMVVNL